MVVLLISFFLRLKESLRPVCQLQVTGHIAAVNPSEALSLPPHSFKFRYKLPQASLSSYPFPIFFEEWGLDVQNITSAWDYKGDIIIGNDVWIGYEAVILSGVTIGDGAIIGTRAVVTKDVPPYTIVGGVPAKTIRKRFSDATIAALLQINWWDWPEEKIKQHISDIQAGRIDRLQPLCKGE